MDQEKPLGFTDGGGEEDVPDIPVSVGVKVLGFLGVYHQSQSASLTAYIYYAENHNLIQYGDIKTTSVPLQRVLKK